MAYIGRDITSLSNAAILDAITFSDSAGPYNLTKSTVAFTPISAQALVISIDGVIQDPGSYTISGSTVTFDTSISSSCTNDFIVHNGVGIVNEVSDGAVTTAKLGTDAVTTAKILDNNVTVAKLPTTLNISGNTVTLPASVSGLGTGIDVTSQITGVVPSANLGSGTASSSTILYGDSTYKSEPAGGAWNLLRTEPASGASSVEFVDGVSGVDLTTYKMYKLQGIDIVASDDDTNALVQFSKDTGSSYEGASNYDTMMMQVAFGGTISANAGVTGALEINNFGNAATEGGAFELTLVNPSGAAEYKRVWWSSVCTPNTGVMLLMHGGGHWKDTDAYDAFQFKMSAGTFSGTVKLYGIS